MPCPPSTASATSASSPTSTPARRRPPSGSCTTPARSTGWGTSTRGPPITDYRPGGARARASRSSRRRSPAAGRTCTINIIDTPGPRRLHGRGRAVAARARRRRRRSSRPSRGSRPRARPSGGRRPSTTSRGSASSTRWTASAPSSSGSSTRSASGCESHPIPVQIPIGAGPEGTMGEFQGLIDLIAMKALYFKTEDLGSTITEAEIPDGPAARRRALARADAQRPERLRRAVRRAVHGPPGGGRADRGPDRTRRCGGPR